MEKNEEIKIQTVTSEELKNIVLDGLKINWDEVDHEFNKRPEFNMNDLVKVGVINETLRKDENVSKISILSVDDLIEFEIYLKYSGSGDDDYIYLHKDNLMLSSKEYMMLLNDLLKKFLGDQITYKLDIND